MVWLWILWKFFQFGGKYSLNLYINDYAYFSKKWYEINILKIKNHLRVFFVTIFFNYLTH